MVLRVGASSSPFSSTILAPSASCRSAPCTTAYNRHPRVSTKMCRLRPTIFFPPIVAAQSARFSGFDALRIHNSCAGLRVLADQHPYLAAECGIHPFPGAVAAPGVEVVPHGRPVGKVMGQGAPGTAVAVHIIQGVDHFAQV